MQTSCPSYYLEKRTCVGVTRGREEGSPGLLQTLHSGARLMEGAWGDQSPGARCLLGGECCPTENEGEKTVNGMGVSSKESRCGGRWKWEG